MSLAVFDPVVLEVHDHVADLSPFSLGQGEFPEILPDHGINRLLSDARRGTGLRVTAVIDVALLAFADQGMLAVLAFHDLAEEEFVFLGARREPAVQDVLDFLEEALRDQGLVIA